MTRAPESAPASKSRTTFTVLTLLFPSTLNGRLGVKFRYRAQNPLELK
jgi:hypothetical protein